MFSSVVDEPASLLKGIVLLDDVREGDVRHDKIR